MSTTISTTPAWVLTGQNGASSLELIANYELPPLGPNDVLVRIHAASLNYRELVIAKVHTSPPQLALLGFRHDD